jgi:phage gp16-like protein
MRRVSSADQIRARKLAAIHIAAGQLKLDDDTYRSILERVTGKRSAADLETREASAVLDELRRLGAANPRAAGKPHNADRLSGEIAKIEAQLSDMRLPWSYADAIGKRMFGIERVAWLRKQAQLVAVLAALHVEQGKRSMLADIRAQCAALDISIDDLERELGLAVGWQRKQSALKVVTEHLKGRVTQ